jgi:hypothetical protein
LRTLRGLRAQRGRCGQEAESSRDEEGDHRGEHAAQIHQDVLVVALPRNAIMHTPMVMSAPTKTDWTGV